jgi:mono/diheme cytochrome c family protein
LLYYGTFFRDTELRPLFLILLPFLLCVSLASCESERRKSDAELGLNAQQAAGRHVFDNRCARCHEPYSSRALQGPSLKGMYQKPQLPSGAPTNDDRVGEVIRYGRAKMPAYGRVLSDQQINQVLAYLHTL